MTNPGTRMRYIKPSTAQFFATFGYAWFTIGLFTGTLVLVLAVRGILDVLQRMGWEQSAQNHLLIGVILLFFALSFLLARRVVRFLYRQTTTTRRLMLVGLAVPAALSLYAWSNPARFLASFAGTVGSSYAMKGGPTFVFGSYPDEDRLKELKRQGVTSVVSLQSRAVLVEISGIKEERGAAAREGLAFIEAPMLPWVSDNTESLEKIKQLALHGKGTYYVHCGLGRDRVNIAKRVIEALEPQSSAHVASSNDIKSAAGFERRTEMFERGMPMKVKEGFWVIPYLNEAEFYGFILQGQPGHLVVILDPSRAEQRGWLANAEKKMKQYAVAYTTMSYPASTGDTSTRTVVAKLRSFTGPVTVIVPSMTTGLGDPIDPVARAIGKEYGVLVKALPKTIKLAPGETLITPPIIPSKPGT